MLAVRSTPVAPHAGAWIETIFVWRAKNSGNGGAFLMRGACKAKEALKVRGAISKYLSNLTGLKSVILSGFYFNTVKMSKQGR
ncbi:MAG: hypothetical protein ACK4S8_15775 [Alishewanella aestuarii]